MSIVIKANELNTLIYKYFLEAGLSHSAYTLFNEAALAQPLQEFRFDVRAGHLLSILEKGLVYAKIESHVNLSQYMDCEQPFSVLKPHTCKLVERVLRERKDAIRQMEQSLNEGIRRTNSIYNTAVPNKDYQDIVYDSKGSKVFQKFPKIKLPPSELDTAQTQKFQLQGNQNHFLLNHSSDYEVDLLKYDSINEEITLQKIFPSIRQGELNKCIACTITNETVIQLFDGNQVTLFEINQETFNPIEFQISLKTPITQIQLNSNLEHLLCFKNREQFFVINTRSYRTICKGNGNFFWKAFDQYLLVEDTHLKLYKLTEKEPKMQFQGNIKWQQIQFNKSRTLFATISYQTNTIHVYTFDNSQPLFIFSLEEQLKHALFITSIESDYLCWLTNQHMKIFDISFNSYSKVIQLEDYDPQVHRLYPLRKANKDQLYLLGLGSQNLLVYDLSNWKMERVELEGKVSELKPLGLERVGMVTDSHIYLLVGQYIDPLFK